MWRSFRAYRAVPNSVAGNMRSFRMFHSSRTMFDQPRQKMTMKELAKKYGWTATGVYVALMAVDLPLSFAFVHSLGKDKLIDWEVKLRGTFGANTDRDATYVARAASGNKGLLLAEFGIAYVIHKILIVIRVPLTIAFTPRVAAKLQQWGFQVNRAVPSVDKAKLAATVDRAKEEVPVAAKTLDKIMGGSKSVKSPEAERIAEKAGQTLQKAAEKEKSALDVNKKFGRTPSKRNKWFLGMF